MSQELEYRQIKRILAGETEVFKHLVREHQSLVYSIAISMVKQESDAKDIVQNAFIQAFRSLKSFKAESKFSTWLYKITVNESLKFISKNKRWGSSIEFTPDSVDLGRTFNSAVAEIDLIDKKAAIAKALELMKPKEALVLKLHYLHEYALSEIESITGFSKSNVKVLLHRARKSFMIVYLEKK